MSGLFPLWMKDTRRLAHEFIEAGFRAILVCIDPKQINPSFCGREFNETLLADLPPTADPCGENGEFHTFVYDGPIFRKPVAVRMGEVVERDGFWFCDLDTTVETAPTPPAQVENRQPLPVAREVNNGPHAC